MDTTATSERLRAVALRVTAPRLAVLEALAVPGHVSAETVYERVQVVLPGTSLQTVYGVLAALSETRLLRRIEPAGSPALYESRTGDNHHHLVCTRCHAVVDVDCVVGEAPCLTPSDPGGFEVAAAEVTFWGLCADCRSEPAA